MLFKVRNWLNVSKKGIKIIYNTSAAPYFIMIASFYLKYNATHNMQPMKWVH